MLIETKKTSGRQVLSDGTFVEWSLAPIRPDKWRPHGVKYRLAYIEKSKCRVLFDNHTGKKDHFHRDGEEFDYMFRGVSQLRQDFETELRKMGVPI